MADYYKDMANIKAGIGSNYSSSKSIDWKHFGKFYLIQVVLITFLYFIGRNVNKDTNEMFYLNISAVLIPPIISAVMIYTYKAPQRLSFKDKLKPLIGLLLVIYLWTISLNYLNPFNRILSEEDMTEGIIVSAVYVLFVFIVCLPIIGFIKKKEGE